VTFIVYCHQLFHRIQDRQLRMFPCTSGAHPPCQVWHTFLAKGVAGLLVLMAKVDEGKLTDLFETFDVMKAQV
jgi:hypothetical protein